MPKRSENALATDLELRSARAPTGRTDFRIKGAQGLLLRVTSNGTKSWTLAYKSPATRRWAKIALGRYPDIGLAEARELAQETAGKIRKGADPILDKREAELTETFAQLATRYMREHGRRNARAGAQSRSTIEAQRQLDRDILPKLGAVRADAVSRQYVMQVVETIAERGSYVAADRALGLIRAIYNWACGTGRMDRNPTLGLKKRNTTRAKTRVLSETEIRTLWHALDDIESITAPIRLALKLQLVTGVRIGEALGAPREELDLERGLWTIAAIRTKAEREHVLPLSQPARAIMLEAMRVGDLAEQRRAARANRRVRPVNLLFPCPRGGDVMDPHAASRAVVRERDVFSRAGIRSFNTHDLRRTVATQLGEMGTLDEIIERILNHAPRTVTARHYNHARYEMQMRAALDAWAVRLLAIVATAEAAPAAIDARTADGIAV